MEVNVLTSVQALELLHRIDMVFVLHYDHHHEEGRHQAPEGEPASSVKIRVLHSMECRIEEWTGA